MTITLTPEQEEIIQCRMAQGDFADADDKNLSLLSIMLQQSRKALMNTYTRREMMHGGAGVLLTSLLASGSEAAHANVRRAEGLKVPCLALSSDAALLAVPLKGKGVGLFGYATGKKMQTLDVPDGVSVESLAFRGRGGRLAGLLLGASTPLVAAGGSDGSVRLWNAQTNGLVGTLAAHQHAVTELLFTPNGKALITASGDEPRFKLWDVEAKTLINEVAGFALGVGALAVSADGKTLAVGGSDKIAPIHLYDIAEPAQTKRFSSYLRGGHDLSVTSLAFSPDGKRLVSGGLDSKVCLWDLAERKTTAVITEHAKPVISVAFHPDGSSVASGSLDKTVRRWEVPTGKDMGEVGKHEGEVYVVLFAPDGKTLVSGGQDGPVRTDVGEK